MLGKNGSYNKGHKPVVHDEFVSNENSRKRYWARSILGYKTFGVALPNEAHRALARLEYDGLIKYLITQNVDRLHQKAGSIHVCDLHGRNDQVVCINCGYKGSRKQIQVFFCCVYFSV